MPWPLVRPPPHMSSPGPHLWNVHFDGSFLAAGRPVTCRPPDVLAIMTNARVIEATGVTQTQSMVGPRGATAGNGWGRGRLEMARLLDLLPTGDPRRHLFSLNENWVQGLKPVVRPVIPSPPKRPKNGTDFRESLLPGKLCT